MKVRDTVLGNRLPAPQGRSETSPAKRRKLESGPAISSGVNFLDPSSLMKAKEGTFKPPTLMRKYLNKHLKRCLPKEGREALFKKHPRQDLHSAVPPKVDKYAQDFLGKRMPKDHDTELSKIQSAILASIWPLTSAWQRLTEEGLEEEPDMLVLGAEVLSLIQRTICLIGKASVTHL